MAYLPLGSGILPPAARLGRSFSHAPAVLALAALLSLASTQALFPSLHVPAPLLALTEPQASEPIAMNMPDADLDGIDPVVMLAVEARSAWQDTISGWAPQPVAPRTDGPPGWQEAFARSEPLPAPVSLEAMLTPQTVPLPVPRPPELRRPGASDLARRPDRQAGRRTVATASPAAMEDTRTFFEKLFGVETPATPALAYAALDRTSIGPVPRRQLVPGPAPSETVGTAIYDITARSVLLPSGERLEAHSGLGDSMDDPRFVHVPMRGATPPGTYDLTERETLFHGVRALRLNPVGGSGAIHGRAGLLAHTFMLGPNGASNGCVSFRDYDKFLQAYLRGEVQRLVVVAGRGQDAGSQIASR